MIVLMGSMEVNVEMAISAGVIVAVSVVKVGIPVPIGLPGRPPIGVGIIPADEFP